MDAAPAPDVTPAPAPAPAARGSRLRRALLWGALVLLLGVAQTLLVVLTLKYEASRTQEQVDTAAGEAAAAVRSDLLQTLRRLQRLSWNEAAPAGWPAEAAALLRDRRELLRIERRDADGAVVESADSPLAPPLFRQRPRRELDVDTEIACAAARHGSAPAFSRSYFVPVADGRGLEVIDLCIPVLAGGRHVGALVGTVSLVQLLDAAMPARRGHLHELSFVEGDGTRLARAGMARGAGVYQADRLVDLPGTTLQLRADSAAGRPSLIPNLLTALVLGLSVALFAVVVLLARDVRRRAHAESQLAEALAYRKAMEDSLITGLRARDLEGRITYVNAAFCRMVGFDAAELAREPQPEFPPYWPPEQAEEYALRQRARLHAGAAQDRLATREGVETVFMRKNGERFPVMIYEAPLVDGQGRHTGWMSAVLDVSAQRRVEELSRQQQDRLQATARLATVGEMASLLSHELNQPLAAIASYATGSLNLMDEPGEHTPEMLRGAMERIAEQAERAGRVIKSVHHFVRRREQQRETIGADLLIDAVLPLVRLQARKSGTRIEVDATGSAAAGAVAPGPGAAPVPTKAPRVACDRTMVEQVLLNLTRNAIQAMEQDTPLAERVLTVRVRQTHPGWVTFSVLDAGPGIAPEVATRLFTPFYTTRSEGMGLGLSLCRTVIEQHGGALDFGPAPGGRGTEFRFTLPAPKGAAPAVPDGGKPEDGNAPKTADNGGTSAHLAA